MSAALKHHQQQHQQRQPLASRARFWSWRGVCLVVVVAPWMVLNAFLLAQPDEASARRFLHEHVDSSLGEVTVELSYADECGWESAWEKIVDPFLFSHLIGWAVATLVLRDFWLTVFLFTLDECLELWWRAAYANFQECWWDSVILDMATCNVAGAYVGILLVRWFGGNGTGRERNMFRDLLRDPRRIAFAGVIALFRTAMFYSLFGWKRVLSVPTKHPLNVLHMLVYLSGLELSLTESYDNMTRRGRTSHFWAGFQWIFTLLDFAVVTKFGYLRGIIDATGTFGRYMALIAGALCVACYVFWYSRSEADKDRYLDRFGTDDEWLASVSASSRSTAAIGTATTTTTARTRTRGHANGRHTANGGIHTNGKKHKD